MIHIKGNNNKEQMTGALPKKLIDKVEPVNPRSLIFRSIEKKQKPVKFTLDDLDEIVSKSG